MKYRILLLAMTLQNFAFGINESVFNKMVENFVNTPPNPLGRICIEEKNLVSIDNDIYYQKGDQRLKLNALYKDEYGYYTLWDAQDSFFCIQCDQLINSNSQHHCPAMK